MRGDREKFGKGKRNLEIVLDSFKLVLIQENCRIIQN